MTEQEEFEFEYERQRQLAAQQEAPTTAGGALSEINKGIGRGLLAMPVAAGAQLARSTEGIPDTNPLKVQPNEDITAFRQRLLSNLKPTPANRTEQMLGTGAELASSIAPFMGGPGKIAEKAFGLAAPVLGGVAGEQYAQEHGYNPEQGKMVGTFAGPLGMAAVGKAFSPQVSDGLRQLIDAGLKPTPGGQTGGFLKRLENTWPFSEIASSAQSRATTSFSTAATNIAIAPLGKTVKGSGTEAFAAADKIASQAYDDVLPKLSIKFDQPAFQELAAQEQRLPPTIRKEVLGIVTPLVKPAIGPGGVIDPAAMKEIDKQLGIEARTYQGDPAVQSQKIHKAIREAQGTLRDMVRRQNPDHAAELDAANAAWNNLVRIGDAVARAKARDGNFTPQQLMQSVFVVDPSAGKAAAKSGGAAMQDVASAGLKYVGGERHSIPMSVVRQGLASGGAAAGLGAAAVAYPAVGIPAAVAGGAFGSMYTPWGQAAAQAALSGQRPLAVQTLGELMREAPSYSPATLPLFTDFARQKEQQ